MASTLTPIKHTAVTGDPTHGYLTEGDKLAISLTELMRQNRTSRYEL